MRYAAIPTAEERQQPVQVRPYTAVNHALFDLYHDMRAMRNVVVVISIVLSVLAVACGFDIGRRWSGLPGAVLLAGVVAFTPVIVEHAGLAKPYSMAWSFAIIGCYCAVAFPSRRGRTMSAVVLGLAVASRVEMLGLLPLSCALVWPTGAGNSAGFRVVLRFLATVAIAALLAAPWLLTNLIGNLRAIATVRFGPSPGGAVSPLETFQELVWGQGLMVPLALLFALMFVSLLWRRREGEAGGKTNVSLAHVLAPGIGVWQRWFIIAYALALLTTVFRQTGYGMRHHGPALIGVMIAAPLAMRPLGQAAPRLTAALTGLGLLIPLVQSVRLIHQHWQSFVPDDATAWIETHVPAVATV